MINTVERFNADLINKLASQANELDSLKTTVADYEKKFASLVKELDQARSEADHQKLKARLLAETLYGKKSEKKKISEDTFIKQLCFPFYENSQPEASEEKTKSVESSRIRAKLVYRIT